MADSGRRVRAELDVAVVARPRSGATAPRGVAGLMTVYEDGGWRMAVDGWPLLTSEDAAARAILALLTAERPEVAA